MNSEHIKYLITFDSQPSNKRKLSDVAKIHGVNRSTVTRAMQQFIKEGFLKDDYSLTAYGETYLKNYQREYQQISKFLEFHDVPKDRVRDDTFAILAGCSKETKQVLSSHGVFCKICQELKVQQGEESVSATEIIGDLSEGRYKVPFVFHKEKGHRHDQISMANEGFVHPAYLTVKKNQGFLELEKKRICRTIDKEECVGMVSSMKYEIEGIYKDIPMDDKMAYIPMEALRFSKLPQEELMHGRAMIKINSSVGNYIMPESKAILTIHL